MNGKYLQFVQELLFLIFSRFPNSYNDFLIYATFSDDLWKSLLNWFNLNCIIHLYVVCTISSPDERKWWKFIQNVIFHWILLDKSSEFHSLFALISSASLPYTGWASQPHNSNMKLPRKPHASSHSSTYSQTPHRMDTKFAICFSVAMKMRRICNKIQTEKSKGEYEIPKKLKKFKLYKYEYISGTDFVISFTDKSSYFQEKFLFDVNVYARGLFRPVK